MDPSALEKLGFTVHRDPEGTGADFLLGIALLNPLSRKPIERVRFRLVRERLVAVEPAALVGTPPLSLGSLHSRTDVELHLSTVLAEAVRLLERRSGEFQSLGLKSHVDPISLLISAEVESDPYRFILGIDKRGMCRVSSASKRGQSIRLEEGASFDLSEFREIGALVGYLRALVGDEAALSSEAEQLPSVTFGELVKAFSDGAQLPPTSSLEILLELRVDGVRLRFAAARVMGRTFRGLLAGSKGKIWAGRFELDAFPGVQLLVADLLKVPREKVEVLSREML